MRSYQGISAWLKEQSPENLLRELAYLIPGMGGRLAKRLEKSYPRQRRGTLSRERRFKRRGPRSSKRAGRRREYRDYLARRNEESSEPSQPERFSR